MGTKSRFRSARHVLNEIEHLYHTRNVRYFIIQDDNFSTDRQRLLDICSGIVGRGMTLQFKINNGVPVNSLTGEVVDSLAAAGLIWTAFPIESGSEYIRNKVIGKNLKDTTIKEAIGHLRRHPQILLNAFFVIGFPEETSETLQATYDLILDLNLDDFITHIVTPFPGTAVYEQCIRDGLLLHGKESGWLYDISAKSLEIEAVGKTEHNIALKPYRLSVAELVEWQERFIELRLKMRSERRRKLDGEVIPIL